MQKMIILFNRETYQNLKITWKAFSHLYLSLSIIKLI